MTSLTRHSVILNEVKDLSGKQLPTHEYKARVSEEFVADEVAIDHFSRLSCHIHKLNAAKMKKAIALAHSGSQWLATITLAWRRTRVSCASAIKPKMTLATRRPNICERIVPCLLGDALYFLPFSSPGCLPGSKPPTSW
jgi:hypothetical protein